MRIDPEGIDAAYKLFDTAYTKVTAKINGLYEAIPQGLWATDPVSIDATVKFNERTIGGDAQSAMAALKGYQKQLASARDALKAAKQTYQNQDEAASKGLA